MSSWFWWVLLLTLSAASSFQRIALPDLLENITLSTKGVKKTSSSLDQMGQILWCDLCSRTCPGARLKLVSCQNKVLVYLSSCDLCFLHSSPESMLSINSFLKSAASVFRKANLKHPAYFLLFFNGSSPDNLRANAAEQKFVSIQDFSSGCINVSDHIFAQPVYFSSKKHKRIQPECFFQQMFFCETKPLKWYLYVSLKEFAKSSVEKSYSIKCTLLTQLNIGMLCSGSCHVWRYLIVKIGYPSLYFLHIFCALLENFRHSLVTPSKPGLMNHELHAI